MAFACCCAGTLVEWFVFSKQIDLDAPAVVMPIDVDACAKHAVTHGGGLATSGSTSITSADGFASCGCNRLNAMVLRYLLRH